MMWLVGYLCAAVVCAELYLQLRNRESQKLDVSAAEWEDMYGKAAKGALGVLWLFLGPLITSVIGLVQLYF